MSPVVAGVELEEDYRTLDVGTGEFGEFPRAPVHEPGVHAAVRKRGGAHEVGPQAVNRETPGIFSGDLEESTFLYGNRNVVLLKGDPVQPYVAELLLDVEGGGFGAGVPDDARAETREILHGSFETMLRGQPLERPEIDFGVQGRARPQDGAAE